MSLTFLPLGGLGEIGMNGLVMDCDGRRYLIDTGVKFPDESTRFAELVLPDLGWLRANRRTFSGIILTHGHEDHIGALPFVLRECKVPVYGSPFSFGLARRRLAEHNITGVDFRPIEPIPGGGLGEFTRPPEAPDIGFQLVRVTHSIPDAASLYLDTPYGRVLHTGDFKIDDEPMDGQAFDHAAFRAIGDHGLDLLMADSTNAPVPGRTGSEAAVVREIEKLVLGWPGRRVLISQFASNIHRLRGLQDVAKKTGRRLCLLGRSLKTYSDIARETGLQSLDPATLLEPDDLASADPGKVIVALTGSQGEARAALARVARGDHPQLRVRSDDLFLLSARVIPGNERGVQHVLNDLTRLGATVVHPKAAPIHTSGHARQDELREMMRLTRPRSFVPLHGEYAFLKDHANIGRSEGIKDILLVEDGEEFRLEPGKGLSRHALHRLTPHYLDGTITGSAEALGFEDRRRLFQNGIVSAVVEVHPGPKGRQIDVELSAMGLFIDEGRHLDEAGDDAVDAVKSLRVGAEERDIEDAVEAAIRRTFRRLTGKKPAVMVFVRRTGSPKA